MQGGYTPLGYYDNNKCSKYEDSTRKKRKEEIKKLLQECLRLPPSQIVARGRDAITAFNNEIENGEITMINSRVMFLGKEGVGKTSLVNAILGKEFNKNEPSTDGIVTTTVFQTVGEDCSRWKEQKDVDVSKLTKQIQENAIAEKVAKKLKPPKSQKTTSKSVSRSSTASSMKEIDGTTITKTLEERGKYRESQSTGAVPKRRAATFMPDSIREKVAAKLHPHLSRQTFKDKVFGKVKGYIKNRKGKDVVPSDVTCIWDYAGQMVYYITHRFYLTDGSSYCVLFSLLDKLDDLAISRDPQKGSLKMTNLQMNVFWIRSIYEHAVLRYNAKKQWIDERIAAPTISLVATHKDKLQGSEEDKQVQIEAKFKRIFDEIEGTEYECHVDREMYVVDNTSASDKGIEQLKKNLGGYTKQMAKAVPTKWVDFQSKVQELGKTTFHMSLDELSKIAFDCGISNSMLTALLDYLNDIGVILYSKTNKKLMNTVITNLHMMIEILAKIITVVKPDDIDKWPKLIHFWHKLDNEGILYEELLRHLWRDALNKNAENFEVFLEVMKMFGLLFEKQRVTQQCNRMFIVPSRMKINEDSLEVESDEKQTISIYVTPTDFLPDAVYHTLVVAFLDLMMDKGRSGNEELFGNRSDFDFDDDHVVSLGAVKIKNRHALKLEITHRIGKDANGGQVISEPHPSVCIEVLNYLKHQLKTVYVTTEGIGYKLRVLCSECQPTEQPHFHDLEDCLKADKVPCGRLLMNTSHLKLYFSSDFDAKSKQEALNFLALQMLIVDRGTKELRRYFLKKTKLTKQEVKPFLTKERKSGLLKNVEFEDQTASVMSTATNIESFDMDIMLKIIRYCCHNTNRGDFWKNPPDDDDSELANLVRICHYKKTILDCSYSNRVTDQEFENKWKELTAMFTGVGVPVEDIDSYRNPWQFKGAMKGFDPTEIEEIQNFQAVFSAIVDLGSESMRKYILEVNKLKKKDVGRFLLNEESKGSFKNMRLFPDQKTKMLTPNADIDKFDITILMLIIRNFCSLPVSFWTNPDKLTNMIHIQQYRNSTLAHTPKSRMSTKDFEIEWKKVRSMLQAVGASVHDIDKYKALRFAT